MVAWAALILWPIVCLAIFKRYSLPVALCVTVLGGYLLLPESIELDLPVLPPINKTTIPAVTALILITLTLRGGQYPGVQAMGWVPRNRMVLLLLGLLVVGTIGTVQSNSDPLIYGPTFISGLRAYDAFSILLSLFVALIPFFLGRRVLADPESQRTLLMALVVAAVVYSVPALYEVRMSPQLHINVYGFFPHEFAQSMRGGGFRPNVFLGHGLALAIFMCFAVIAAAGLYKATAADQRAKYLIAVCWIFAMLFLCKSLGAFLIASVIVPVVLLCTPRTQLLVATGLCGVVLFYPMLRFFDLVPVHELHSFLEARNPARAQSLGVRLYNEDLLLEKAKERPVFGWGIWARNRVFNDWGRDITIIDGAWIYHFGVGGWVRYLGVFGLLCWPVIGLLLYKRQTIDAVGAALALVLVAGLVDLLPNDALGPLIWLMTGSLVGRLERQSDAVAQAEVPSPDTGPRSRLQAARDPTGGPRYTRMPHSMSRASDQSPAQSRSRSAGKTPYSRRVPGGHRS